MKQNELVSVDQYGKKPCFRRLFRNLVLVVRNMASEKLY